MASTDVTKLFLRYRETGDPEALAKVFDRVAPDLLLVAAHLSRDHTIAEDLVQTTFVAAMESADQSQPDDDHGRFVMPHLLPGEYAIWRKLRSVSHGRAAYWSHAPFDEYIQLTTGHRTTQEFHSKLGSLLIRFKHPDGAPLEETYVRLILRRRTRWSEDEKTDARGVLRFGSFPCGEIELEVARGNYRLVPSRIHLRGTGDAEQFDVVVHGADKSK